MKRAKVESPYSCGSLDEFEVPEGWVSTSVGELFHIVGGGTPSTKNPEYWEGNIPWISSADIYGLKKIVPRRNINQTAIENSAAHLVPKGSIIVVTRVSLGRIAICDTPISFSQDCHGLIPKTELVDPEFALYYLSQAVQSFKSQSRGTTISGVTVKVVSSLPFPLPPLAEQKHIVARVEALLTQVNTARDRLSRVPLIMKKFRQAVLAAACEGRLTEGWREENQKINSSKKWMDEKRKKYIDLQPELLIPEYLPDLPETWEYCTVGQVSQFVGSGITPKGGRDVYVSKGIPFIRSQNVYPEGLILDDIAFVSEKMHQEMKRTHVVSNDVLLNITGASIGRCTTVPLISFEANVNQHVCIIRVVSEFFPQYLSKFFNSSLGQKQIFDSQGGVTRQGLNYSQLRSIILPLPPLTEQHEIVRRVNALFDRADQIEEQVVAATKRAEVLTQAVLGKAFAGRL